MIAVIFVKLFFLTLSNSTSLKLSLNISTFHYNKHRNTGARQKIAVHDVMLFKIFDWTIASIIAFDWL